MFPGGKWELPDFTEPHMMVGTIPQVQFSPFTFLTYITGLDTISQAMNGV